MAMCIYVGCTSVQKPFSSLAFFNLPKDLIRRSVWIQNSGNKQLLTLSNNARRVVCEKHFTSASLRKQFHRTILCRGAVPEKWNHNSDESSTDGEVNIVDDQCYDQSINGERLEDWQTGYDDSITKDAECGQTGYDDSMTNDAECEVLEITVNSDSSKHSEPDPDTEDVTVEYVNDEDRQIDDEDPQLLEPISTDSKPQDHLNIEVQEVEIVEKQLSPLVESEIKPRKIRKRLLEDESVLPDDINHWQGESTVCEVVVSSSSVKSNQTQTFESSTADIEANSEDKYFALSLIGILTRIPPQKRAFAKLNIMRYLTELEYGLETSLK